MQFKVGDHAFWNAGIKSSQTFTIRITEPSWINPDFLTISCIGYRLIEEKEINMGFYGCYVF